MQGRGVTAESLNASITGSLGPDDSVLYRRVWSCALGDNRRVPTYGSEKRLQTVSDAPWAGAGWSETAAGTHFALSPLRSVVCWGVRGTCRQMGKEPLQKQVGSYRHPGGDA